MMFATDRKLIVLHFNRRANGGGLVLHNISESLASELTLEVCHMYAIASPYSVLVALASRRIIVFSSPLLIPLLFWRRACVHVVQSIDEDLFSAEDFHPLAVACYRFVVSKLLRKSRNIKIFNSVFTESHYKNLCRSVGVYDCAGELYFQRSTRSRATWNTSKSFTQVVWVGTHHSRKGFTDLIKIAKNNQTFSFVCIFSGKVPRLADLPKNIEVLQNLDHPEVLNIVASSQYSLITSSFESLCLPIYEGLAFGNRVIARDASYIELNGLTDYVTRYESADEVRIDRINISPPYYFKDPSAHNQSIIEEVKGEL